ncbi:acidic fibroblast growth factor intracellular-binding protein isoform X2 [Hirundo rustica]|uniref:acidic fibroblast growth factor intracellular-binding protein isoform X2 n=1 Tax=Hirundo rustica TaxID=43150 RepID=UPI001A945364|nr:acidic fibroblast growth factor intracellular-binding protein isoform X2 [Hirundo rustica]
MSGDTEDTGETLGTRGDIWGHCGDIWGHRAAPAAGMSSDLDVFVGNTTLIDEEVYRLWLDGHSVAEAVARRLRGGVLEREGTSVAVLQSDTRDHYRTFQMLERLLHVPPRLLQQLLFQIPPERQALLVQRYYAFDEALARELLGKKLSKGTKKELDEVSARTGVGIRSCRRQFDNFKRVFKAVEELRGPLAENIQQLFLLPPPLARRFETGKRRLQFLSFADFAACAQSMMGHWSQGALAPEAAEPDGDLPKSFLQDLKELKVLVTDKDLLDQHKSLVCSALRGKISVYNELEASFKALSRALVNVGGKLTHARDVRDFFVDLVEKVIEPCRSDKWSPGDLRLFLTHYTAAPRNLPGFRHQALWERYMAAITACLLRMYHD